MKSRIVNYFPVYMYSVFTLLLAIGYEHGDVPSSFTFIERTYGVNGAIIIIIFALCSIIMACIWFDYRLRAAALLPLMLYGITTPYAFQIQSQGSQFYTGLIAGHFWSCFAISLIIYMLVLHDNHLQRVTNFRLLDEIRFERMRYEAISQGSLGNAE